MPVPTDYGNCWECDHPEERHRDMAPNILRPCLMPDCSCTDYNAFSPEQNAYYAHQQEHYSKLNARLREPRPEDVENYMMLRNRAARLVRLLTMQAPRVVIMRETELVSKTLDAIDSEWRSRPPE